MCLDSDFQICTSYKTKYEEVTFSHTSITILMDGTSLREQNCTSLNKSFPWEESNHSQEGSARVQEPSFASILIACNSVLR